MHWDSVDTNETTQVMSKLNLMTGNLVFFNLLPEILLQITCRCISLKPAPPCCLTSAVRPFFFFFFFLSPLSLQEERVRISRSLFKDLSELRGKERSLIHGDFHMIHSSNSSLAFLRRWDQSSRYLAAFNWAAQAVTLQLTGADLPTQATVQLSTESTPPKGSAVQLAELELGPQQAVLLSYPYSS